MERRADGSLIFDTKLDTDGMVKGIKTMGSTLGNVAAGGLKIFAATTTAATAGITALSTAAINSYANYEQLVGGVETLFGTGGKGLGEYAASVGKTVAEAKGEFESLMTAQNEVMENASKAYKTAGMSANAYMETVTSFAASLKQSTANELEAAKAADQAVIDMADNANKMGTSMEMIQNAYQGFAKQNYTMLDNLKLGYGGTATEMARLINDSGVLGDALIDLTDTKNIGNALADVGLAKMYEAIHIVQTEMGITGTTAKEAATTISGSIGMMKASWENLITGIADSDADLEQLITNLVDSVETVAGNLMPVLETSFLGIGQLITTLLPMMMAEIPGIINEVLPQLLTSGMEMIETILTGIRENLPAMVSGALAIVTGLAEGFLTLLPAILELGVQLLVQLVHGIANALPTLLPTVVSVVKEIRNILSSNLPMLLEMGYEMLAGLVSGIVEGVPDMLPRILEFIQMFGDSLAEQAPVWIEKGFELLSMLVDGIISAFPILVERVPEIISTFANIINDNFPTVLLKGAEIIWQLVTGLLSAIPTIISNIPQILTAIVDAFMAFQWINLGGNIIKMLTDGIKSMIGLAKGAGDTIFTAFKTALQNLPSTLSNLGSNAIQIMCNAVKGLLGLAKGAATTIFNGIVSVITALPTKLMSIGGEIVKGLWKGISDNAGWILGQIGEFATGIINKVKNVFKVKSPSKEFQYIGEMCVAGFDVGSEGFEESAEGIERTADGMTRHIKASIGTMSANTSVSRKEEYYSNMKSAVNVYLEGDAKGVFKLVRQENDVFKKSTGQSALA